MSSLLFVKFTEENEWEGETWNFWLQKNGNEAELLRLRAVLEKTEGFTISLAAELHEDAVDVIVSHSDTGYMNFENKVTGVLRLPEGFESWTTERQEELLYKGGIKDAFTEV